MTAERSTDRWPVRTLRPEEWAAFVAVDSHAFGATAPDELLDAEKELFGAGRDIGVFDGDTLAGIATAYPFELGVPGRILPAAGVSWVGVLPTHRRRGILSALMDSQLSALHDEGRPLALLWASEPPIYGRYGYGLASRFWSLTVPREPAALLPDTPADPQLRLRLVPAGEWALTAGVYEIVAGQRPGIFARDERWWQRAVRDLPSMRAGSSELRCVVAEDGSGVRGYARYSTKQDFNDFGNGTVSVREVMAVDPAARAALYRYLFDLDLMGSTHLWNVPVDDPLLHWLANPRKAKPAGNDALYVRLVDVDGALAGRCYATDVDLVIGVRDERCPWNDGRWRVTGGRHGASCVRTRGAADVEMGVRELGAIFLGGTSVLELAAAGRVSGSPAALHAATSAFAHSPAPWCPVVF